MGVDKNQAITAGVTITAGISGAALAGPAGAAVAMGAAGYATNRYLSGDSPSEED